MKSWPKGQEPLRASIPGGVTRRQALKRVGPVILIIGQGFKD